MKSARRMLEIIALATLLALGAFKAWSMLGAGGNSPEGADNLDLSGDGMLLLVGLGGLCAIALAALLIWALRGRGPTSDTDAPEAGADIPVPPARSAAPNAQARWRGHAQPKPGVFGRRAER